MTAGPVPKYDRNLDDRQALVDGSHRHLYLEAVTGCLRILEGQALQRRGRPGTESAGSVSHRDAQHTPCVNVSTTGQKAPVPGPVGSSASLDIARPQAEVSAGVGCSDQA